MNGAVASSRHKRVLDILVIWYTCMDGQWLLGIRCEEEEEGGNKLSEKRKRDVDNGTHHTKMVFGSECVY